MSWLSRLAGGEQRSLSDEALETPSEAFLDILGGGPIHSRETVTVDGSLQLVPVYSAISQIAGAIGSLPMLVYRRLEGGRERATNHRTWRLLHDQPNPEMAADELWELISVCLLAWGNAFLAKIRDRTGMVSELWMINPKRVQVGRDSDGRLFYLLDGKGQRWREDSILHIRGLGTDGIVGLSPIQQARQMLGGVKATERFTGTFWANSGAPGGVLSHPNKLSPEAAQRLKATWKSAHGGPRNAGETAILEEGMEWKQVGMPLQDAQFIETKSFSHLEIALMFQLPPYRLGAKTGDSMTYSNIESQGIDFIRWTLSRWLKRIEGALLRDPSLFVQGQRFYPEFLVEGLLRADTKTRYEAYAIALDPQKGWMDRNEVREIENLQPKDAPELPAPEPEPDSAPKESDDDADTVES